MGECRDFAGRRAWRAPCLPWHGVASWRLIGCSAKLFSPSAPCSGTQKAKTTHNFSPPRSRPGNQHCSSSLAGRVLPWNPRGESTSCLFCHRAADPGGPRRLSQHIPGVCCAPCSTGNNHGAATASSEQPVPPSGGGQYKPAPRACIRHILRLGASNPRGQPKQGMMAPAWN